MWGGHEACFLTKIWWFSWVNAPCIVSCLLLISRFLEKLNLPMFSVLFCRGELLRVFAILEAFPVMALSCCERSFLSPSLPTRPSTPSTPTKNDCLSLDQMGGQALFFSQKQLYKSTCTGTWLLYPPGIRGKDLSFSCSTQIPSLGLKSSSGVFQVLFFGISSLSLHQLSLISQSPPLSPFPSHLLFFPPSLSTRPFRSAPNLGESPGGWKDIVITGLNRSCFTSKSRHFPIKQNWFLFFYYYSYCLHLTNTQHIKFCCL